MYRSSRKLLKFLAEKKETLSPLLILTHDYPDPDAMASAFALKYLVENGFGITARIVYGGVIGRMENRAMVHILKIPIRKLRKGDFKKHNHIALVDTQPAFKNNSFTLKRKPTLVIDQHASVVKPEADLAIVDAECGATAVILAEALLLFGVDIPRNIATALAYGILTDTMNLYRASRKDIIQAYLNLLPYCDLKALARIQNPSRSRRFFKTLGNAIKNAMSRRGLVVCHLENVENPDLVSQVADFLLTYKQMTQSLCTGRYRGKLYVSLRLEKATTNAGEILRDVFLDRGEAGGHQAIAGGSFKVGLNASEETWQESESSITQRLLKRLRIPVKGEFRYLFR